MIAAASSVTSIKMTLEDEVVLLSRQGYEAEDLSVKAPNYLKVHFNH